MNRRATPRPEYDTPTLVTQGNVTRHLWGDEESGRVGDEVLISSHELHALIFTLAAGGRFGHSPDNRTVFAADEVYAVLEGTIAVINPATGQTVRAETGDFVFFRRDTWHHGINWGEGPVRVLEFFSPPPAAGAASAYAKEQPYLARTLHGEPEAIGHWPMDRAELAGAATMTHLRLGDVRWRAEGDLQVGLVCSTEYLTVTWSKLLAGQRSLERSHEGDALVHLTRGELHVHTPDGNGPNWWRLLPGESLAIPRGFAYQMVNQSGAPIEAVIASAPGYLSGGAGG